MQDSTAVDVGTYHDFRQGWAVDLERALNRGVLPAGYYAMIDMPDPPPGDRTECEAEGYARTANRISVRSGEDRVVAVVEIVSPGNKHSDLAVQAFTRKLAEFIRSGVHVLLIDPFRPGPWDPGGLHRLVWERLTGQPAESFSDDKPLTAASYEAGGEPTAYVWPFAVGDQLPAMPLFLEPGWYVGAPLAASYQASWDVLPAETKDLFARS